MVNASLPEGCIPASQFTEDSRHDIGTQEAVIGCWRLEKLWASIQLDVHVEGCRENCRWASCRIFAVKRFDAAVAVSYRLPYRRQHATETALLRVLWDIFCAADRQHVTLLALLDLSTAFDCVDHDILIRRLQRSYGIGGSVIAWIQSFLRDRIQQVSYADSQPSYNLFSVCHKALSLVRYCFCCTLLRFSTSSRRLD